MRTSMPVSGSSIKFLRKSERPIFSFGRSSHGRALVSRAVTLKSGIATLGFDIRKTPQCYVHTNLDDPGSILIALSDDGKSAPSSTIVTRMNRRILALAVVATLAWCQALDQAKRAFDRGDYATAARLFEQAHQASPNCE